VQYEGRYHEKRFRRFKVNEDTRHFTFRTSGGIVRVVFQGQRLLIYSNFT
jgi:hypothetical protein